MKKFIYITIRFNVGFQNTKNVSFVDYLKAPIAIYQWYHKFVVLLLVNDIETLHFIMPMILGTFKVSPEKSLVIIAFIASEIK